LVLPNWAIYEAFACEFDADSAELPAFLQFILKIDDLHK